MTFVHTLKMYQAFDASFIFAVQDFPPWTCLWCLLTVKPTMKTLGNVRCWYCFSTTATSYILETKLISRILIASCRTVAINLNQIKSPFLRVPSAHRLGDAFNTKHAKSDKIQSGIVQDQVRVLTLIDVGSRANGGKSGGKLGEGVMRIQNSQKHH